MAATIDRMLLEWWNQTAALNQLVPVDRVTTEIEQTDEEDADDEDSDWLIDDCVVYDIATESLYRTNSGQGFRSDVELMAYSHSYEAAKTIIQQVRSSWERQTFTLDGSKITTCFVGAETTEQDETDGRWAVTVDLTINHTTA